MTLHNSTQTRQKFGSALLTIISLLIYLPKSDRHLKKTQKDIGLSGSVRTCTRWESLLHSFWRDFKDQKEVEGKKK